MKGTSGTWREVKKKNKPSCLVWKTWCVLNVLFSTGQQDRHKTCGTITAAGNTECKFILPSAGEQFEKPCTSQNRKTSEETKKKKKKKGKYLPLLPSRLRWMVHKWSAPWIYVCFFHLGRSQKAAALLELKKKKHTNKHSWTGQSK